MAKIVKTHIRNEMKPPSSSSLPEKKRGTLNCGNKAAVEHETVTFEKNVYKIQNVAQFSCRN